MFNVGDEVEVIDYGAPGKGSRGVVVEVEGNSRSVGVNILKSTDPDWRGHGLQGGQIKSGLGFGGWYISLNRLRIVYSDPLTKSIQDYIARETQNV